METVTSLKQWRARQLIYHPNTDDLEKSDIGLEELESNIPQSRKTYIFTQTIGKRFFYT
jgi:hypothetical protein